MERRAAAGRLTREQRVAELRAAVDAAADVQDAARVVHAEAAAAADRAERRAEHARDVLSTTCSVAERAADRATGTAGDAAFARTFATGLGFRPSSRSVGPASAGARLCGPDSRRSASRFSQHLEELGCDVDWD